LPAPAVLSLIDDKSRHPGPPQGRPTDQPHQNRLISSWF